MSSEIIIDAQHLSKKFCRSLRKSMYYGASDAARQMFGLSVDSSLLRPNEFWALDDVSFQVKRGETLGIVGGNGSGKSTLLRVLTGIYPPDKGSVAIRGRVSALIAVGAGFHPHMTGRENIFLNAAILGMKQDEVKKNLDSIIDFAEVGDFIDSPVSAYSSGMHVRLGFSIAIHCDPDILIADEILSVGDYVFQQKCFAKIRELLARGVSILLVSHSDMAIRSVCDRVAILHRHRMVDIGPTDPMLTAYRNILLREMVKERSQKQLQSPFTAKEGATTTGLAVIHSLRVENKSGQLLRKDNERGVPLPYSRNALLRMQMEIEALTEIPHCRISFYLRDMSRSELTYVCGVGVSAEALPQLKLLAKGQHSLSLEMDISGLTPGIYTIVAGIADERFHTTVHASIDESDAATIEISHSPELTEADVILNRPYYIPFYRFGLESLAKGDS